MIGHVIAPLRREWSLALLAAAVAWLLWASSLLQPLERPAADMMLRLPTPRPIPDGPFVAVLIDDASVDRLGPLPWPRSRIAALIGAIWRRGADAVVIDFLLSEVSTDAEDAELARALNQGPFVLAAALAPGGGWLLPAERFGDPANAAHAHAEVASDGVMRRISATKQAGGIALPALSVAAARLAGWRGAISPGRSLRPDFRVPPDRIRQLSAHRVLGDADREGDLSARVVFVGLSATGATDQFVVPVGERGRPVPGVLVHAAAASSITRDGLLRPAGGWTVLLACAFVGAVVGWARTLAGRFQIGWVLAIIGLVVAASLVALWNAGVVLPLVTLVAAVAAAAAGREALESREAQRETATVLVSLIEQQTGAHPPALPRGVGGRLRLARGLQRQIARDRDLRRALLDGLREGVVLWDASGAVLLANEAVTSLWGGTPTRSEVLAMIGGVEGGPTEVAHADTIRDGRELEVELREIEAGFLGLFRDVTAERELERHRSEMQRMVSHELKTPLSSISGFGAMIERYELDRDEQLRVAERIRGEADRLGEMVATFLDLERLGAGRWQASRSEVDLGVLVADRCRTLGPNAENAGVELGVSVVAGCSVHGSTELLVRLVDNLVGNSIKYSPEGAAAHVSVARSPGGVVLAVRDNGPGIPEEALPHLFERFYRVPGTARPGTGLGLALVREIAEWHGAEITVDSELGVGSLFRVWFSDSNHEEGA